MGVGGKESTSSGGDIGGARTDKINRDDHNHPQEPQLKASKATKARVA
jgi:hypothetical protein